ncbi:hypothetical protein [Enterococcus nangangensis]|uniref:hypothetical protein n=1 Tax=Enterococcus nangangensis TaxID=2559926 RepID=UPI0010F6C419|nr:hypothetical protein [Enterococcus nangangensis]
MKYTLVRYALLLELGLVSLISILTLAKDFRYLQVDDNRYLSDSTYRLQVDAWQKFGAAHIVGQERYLKSPVIIFLLVLSLLFVVFLFSPLFFSCAICRYPRSTDNSLPLPFCH